MVVDINDIQNREVFAVFACLVRVGPLSCIARPVAQAKSSITTSTKLRLSATVRTNLIARVSHIPGHEIRMVSYALWDGGDCLLY